MTQPRRDWLTTFADAATLSDLRAAMVDCMADVCEHDPAECDCQANRMTPLEVYEWLELKVNIERGKPVRFEPGYRPRRLKDEPEVRDLRLNLAAS